MHCKNFLSIVVLVCTFSSFCFAADGLKAVGIAGGSEASLVVADNNEVFAAGSDYFSQLGNGVNGGTQPNFKRVLKGQMSTSTGLLENIAGVAGGYDYSLALDKSKYLWSVGENYYGQLGNGKDHTTSGYIGYETTPVQVVAGDQGSGQLQNIIAISASNGGQFSLAVDSSHFCYGFGANYSGQLGQSGQGLNSYNTPKKVLGGFMGTQYLQNIIAVAAGSNNSMALTSGGNVYTFGANMWNYGDGAQYGKLGVKSATGAPSTTPVEVVAGQMLNTTHGYLENISAISAGSDHCMALVGSGTYAGKILCWGNNSRGPNEQGDASNPLHGGQLGNGTTNDTNAPVFVLKGEASSSSNYLENIKAIAAGGWHCLAIDSNNCVVAWGDNYYGQLSGTATNSTTPIYVKLADGHRLSNIVKIAAGSYASYAVDSDGVLWVWGSLWNDKLGLGGYTGNQIYPAAVQFLPVHNNTSGKDYYTIGEAVNDANSGDTLVLESGGTYYENIDVEPNRPARLTIKSTYPANPSIVAGTVIDGGDDAEAINFSGTGIDYSGLTLDGLTIRSSIAPVVNLNDSNDIIRRCQISTDGGTCVNISGCDVNLVDSTFDGGKTANSYGIYVTGGEYVTVHNCQIQDCTNYGIYFYGNQYPNFLVAYDNIISGSNGSNGCGIYLNSPSSSPSQIYDNFIYGNKDGVEIANEGSTPVNIRNDTLTKNSRYGLYFSSSDSATVSNCIVWNNNTVADTNQIFPIAKSKVTFCDVQHGFSNGTNIINSDPCFVAPDTNDFHLKSAASPCVDANTANWTPLPGETDIFGDPRVLDGNGDRNAYVDLGADEFWAGDFYADNTVNGKDFAILAKAWQTHTGNANWNSACDLIQDGVIDYKDLQIFAGFWLTSRSVSYVGEGQLAMEPPGDSNDSNDMMQSQIQSQQNMQTMDEQTQEAPIYLYYDGNQPNPGDEVTVWVQTDTPLYLMVMNVDLVGDADISAVMSSADCNQYGWIPGFSVDSNIYDANGCAQLGGTAWPSDANGVVGYFKFIYHSGWVGISIDSIITLSSSFQDVECSYDPLFIGRDPD